MEKHVIITKNIATGTVHLVYVGEDLAAAEAERDELAKYCGNELVIRLITL